MGIIIAITISKPVELRMFKTEVDVKLQEEQTKLFNENIKNVKVQFGENIDFAEAEILRLREETTDSRLRLEDLENRLTAEIQGKVGSGREGYGPAARRLEEQIVRAKEEYDTRRELNDAAIVVQEDNLSKLKTEQQANLKKLKQHQMHIMD